MQVLCSWILWCGYSEQVCQCGRGALSHLACEVQLPHLHWCTLTCGGQEWRFGTKHIDALMLV